MRMLLTLPILVIGLIVAISTSAVAQTVDVYFAPIAPAGQESNRIFTTEGKPFFVMFRIYGQC